MIVSSTFQCRRSLTNMFATLKSPATTPLTMLLRALCLALAIFATGCQREDTVEFRFRYSNAQPVGALRSQSMQFFKTALEKRTGGRIAVDLYFGGVLGNERELMDFVATGALQGTRGGFFADANPKFSLLMMPFLVDDWDQAMRLMGSDFVSEINREAAKPGYHIPATGISQGFRAHTNNQRPATFTRRSQRPQDAGAHAGGLRADRARLW